MHGFLRVCITGGKYHIVPHIASLIWFLAVSGLGVGRMSIKSALLIIFNGNLH